MSSTRKERKAARELEERIDSHLKREFRSQGKSIWFALPFDFSDGVAAEGTLTVTILKHRGEEDSNAIQHSNSQVPPCLTMVSKNAEKPES
jgi:hypothetical protein